MDQNSAEQDEFRPTFGHTVLIIFVLKMSMSSDPLAILLLFNNTNVYIAS